MLTDQERETLCTHLSRTAQLFRDAIAGVSLAQWSFDPGGGMWSIAEIAEHVALTEMSVFERVRASLPRTPPDPDSIARAKQKDRVLLERVPVRTFKAQAPVSAQPARRWATPAQALEAFHAGRDRTLRYAGETQDDLRSRVEHLAALKELDGYQGLLLISVHTERHVAQIDEVEAAPGYPNHA